MDGRNGAGPAHREDGGEAQKESSQQPSFSQSNSNGQRTGLQPSSVPGRKTDRCSPRRNQTLATPVDRTFWINRSGHVCRIRLFSLDNLNMCSITRCLPGRDGKLQAGERGLTIAARKIPELIENLEKAFRHAVAAGLVRVRD